LDNLNNDELWQLIDYEQKIREMYNFEYKKAILAKVPVKIAISDLADSDKSEEEYASTYNKNIELAPLPRFLEEEKDETNAVLRGTATHLFMQFADFGYAKSFTARDEAAKLLNNGFLTQAQHDRINFRAVDNFFSSDLYSKVISAKQIYREIPFLLKAPVSSEILSEVLSETDNTDAAGLSGEYILIQGAIDLFFEDPEGKIHVVDFKTDYIKSTEDDTILIDRYKRQLAYYCMAAGEIANKPIGGAYIYSFSLDRTVKII
jgi:ATP-dependent helicase/nuclease subunit A